MRDLHIPGDQVANNFIEKFNRCEVGLKNKVHGAIWTAGIKCLWEQRIYQGGDGYSKWALLADLASWPHKGWLIECKRKADISSCSKALGQCLMYRAMAGYEHPIICFPVKEYYHSPCIREFEKVCKSHNIELAHDESILKIIQHYESIYTTGTNSELRTVQDGGTSLAVT